jgi:hypothetical protein
VITVRTLSCYSSDATLESLAQLLDASAAVIAERLTSLDELEFEPSEVDFPVWLWARVANNARPPAFDVVWFHATRVPVGTDFRTTGLLPTKLMIEQLSKLVLQIGALLGLPKAPPMVGFAQSYAAKLETLETAGPYAFLVREAAVHPRRPSRNFLRCPEVFEDIAGQHFGDRWEEVVGHYQRENQPCVVSFLGPEGRLAHAQYALRYCYRSLRRSDNPAADSGCFCGDGTVIPGSAITDVEWL